MDAYKVVATFRFVVLGMVLLGMSEPLLAQQEIAGPSDLEDATLVFKASRSHAGGSRYVPVELSLGDRGMSWRFEAEFERHVDIPWSALKKWSCWGRGHGYKLEFLVEEPEDGGGTFRLRADELEQAETYLLERVALKANRRCKW